jgi:hypothetical protein
MLSNQLLLASVKLSARSKRGYSEANAQASIGLWEHDEALRRLKTESRRVVELGTSS